MLIALQKKTRILCTREHQNSIKDSVHKLLSDIIIESELVGFTITEASIRHANGSEFIFKGLRHNINDIKSTEGIDICWVEEAQVVSQTSWDILIPTIRKEGSEIWVSFNPDSDTDPTYVKFVSKPPPESEILSLKVNYDKNPWFSETLRMEMEHMKRTDPVRYDWVWLGNTRQVRDNLVFKDKYEVAPFEIDKTFGIRLPGLDFGFSNDPLAFVELYVKDNILYVNDEAGGVGIDTVDIKHHLARFNLTYEEIPSDCARPESISQLRKDGLNAVSCKKWKGCIEDGIDFLRGFEKIVIHPRCVNTIGNFNKYQYKTDRLTGLATRDIVDSHNDFIDAIRYALEKLITKKKSWAGLYD